MAVRCVPGFRQSRPLQPFIGVDSRFRGNDKYWLGLVTPAEAGVPLLQTQSLDFDGALVVCPSLWQSRTETGFCSCGAAAYSVGGTVTRQLAAVAGQNARFLALVNRQCGSRGSRLGLDQAFDGKVRKGYNVQVRPD